MMKWGCIVEDREVVLLPGRKLRILREVREVEYEKLKEWLRRTLRGAFGAALSAFVAYVIAQIEFLPLDKEIATALAMLVVALYNRFMKPPE